MAPQREQCNTELKKRKQKPLKWHQKTQKTPRKTSPQKKGGELHGVVNPHEAAILVHSLDEALIILEAQIAEGEDKIILGETVAKFKEAISRVIPNMTGADVEKVVGAIKDPTCLAM